ncbi:ankyrin repeat domain-containing protein 26-like isoform X9 [Rhinolophus sinicus]|uniref:ankyrin repeat domain-containing protein 26-like isoform X9 n=1 Tax=Rhinolophus sinicus TaxID=89399 RepID=UPI003D7B60C2
MSGAEGLATPLGSARKEGVHSRHKTRVAPLESKNSSQRHGAVKKTEGSGSYQIEGKDLRKIHRAACSGDVPEVQRLLLLRPGRLNDRDRQKRTALHLACDCGRLGVVTLLIERKCKLNLQDNKKLTALMKAVQAQEEECASFLLENGADPNIKDECGCTALHYAVLVGNTAIAAKLLQHRADIEATDKWTSVLRKIPQAVFPANMALMVHGLHHRIKTSMLIPRTNQQNRQSEKKKMSIPGRRPKKYIDSFLFADHQRGKYVLPAQVEEIHLSTESEKEQVRLDGRENNHCHVSESHEKQKDLMREIAILRLELDTAKNKHQEMEKKYFEDMAVVKGKTDHLQDTIKLNEETLRETMFEYHRQLNVLTAENKRLTFELRSEKQNRERLETEVESYRSELATAIQAFEQRQESERYIQLFLQRARKELFGLRDKLNFDMSHLKHNNEILSQRLSNVESKFSSLETEFHHIRDVLSEAMNEKRAMTIQNQIQDMVKLCQTQSEKLDRALEERNKEVISRCTDVTARLHRLGNPEAGREVVGTQLQQELADNLNEQSLPEPSLEVIAHDRMNPEAERQDLMTTSEQMRRQFQEARDQHAEDSRRAEKMQDPVPKLENENMDFQVTTAKEAGIVKQLQRLLLRISSMDQELQEKITREQREDGAAVVEPEFKRAFPLTALLVQYAKNNMSLL